MNATESCDQTSGQCFCKPNTDTRTCRECKDQFYAYPTNADMVSIHVAEQLCCPHKVVINQTKIGYSVTGYLASSPPFCSVLKKNVKFVFSLKKIFNHTYCTYVHEHPKYIYCKYASITDLIFLVWIRKCFQFNSCNSVLTVMYLLKIILSCFTHRTVHLVAVTLEVLCR